MAVDSKYGSVSLERGNVGLEEPVVVFRAQDELLPDVLQYYYELCKEVGSSEEHLKNLAKTRSVVVEWQKSNYTQVPKSATVQAPTSTSSSSTTGSSTTSTKSSSSKKS